MPRTKNGSLPTYRLYKRTGQAVVTIDGHDHYLGEYGSRESKTQYQRLIDAWLARTQSGDKEGAPAPLAPDAPGQPTVNQLILAYIRYAKSYYRPDSRGEQKEVGCIRDALRILRELSGWVPATGFGPKALKAVRAVMMEKDWARTYINRQIDRVRRMFRWATEEQLIPATVYHGLQAVRGLRKGLPGVRESKTVRPVSPRHIQSVLKRVRPMLRALIRFQLHTGCRPGEALRLKPKRIDRSGDVWIYRPGRHKTAHQGKRRRILIGPRAQKVLGPWLKGIAPDDFVFSPVRAEAVRQAERSTKRKTPLWPSHLKSQAAKQKPEPKRAKRNRYDVPSYRRAIKRACRLAGIPSWSPNRLRPTAATRIRRS